MPDSSSRNSQNNFADAFGDALRTFLDERGLKQAAAAKEIGLDDKKGRGRINSYCRDSEKHKRPKPDAEILYLLCTKLNFRFQYSGYEISAATLNGRPKSRPKPAEQLPLQFDRQFNLTDEDGTVSVRVRRPPGRIEVSLSLKSTAS